ncbi:MAG: amidohydrolase, partial [Candidatus Binatia bacterium]|nr:amidohydrolase [Candidatus Binatia bacterium]
MSGYTIIDVDTHVTETPDLWTSRAPASMRNRVPRIETDKEGRLSWVVGEGASLIANPGLTATAGVGSMKNPPKTFEEMHPGA